MADFGLTAAGYIAPRSADFLAEIKTELTAELALLGDTVDFEADVVLNNLIGIIADRLGELGEATQALFDAFDVGNATGLQLSNLGLIVGVVRLAATFSTVSLDITGTVATPIPAGSVAVGGDVALTRWLLVDDATIGGGGTVSAIFQAEEKGKLTAAPATITQIGTPVTGWDTVNNPLAAIAGNDIETDADFRVRRQDSLQIAGGGSNNAIRANVVVATGVLSAAVIDNPENTVEVVEGESLQPNSVLVIVHPNTLTTAQKQDVADRIYARLCAGIETNGTDVVATVTGLDGFAKTIKFDFAVTVSVTVDITVSLAPGFELGDVSQAVTDEITDVFDQLEVGETLRLLEIRCEVAKVTGIDGIPTLLLQGAATDFNPTIKQLVVAGTITVT